MDGVEEGVDGWCGGGCRWMVLKMDDYVHTSSLYSRLLYFLFDQLNEYIDKQMNL